jgi:hypothetical protein
LLSRVRSSLAPGANVTNVAVRCSNSFEVSPSGNDHNAGTIAAPWRTMTHAANFAGAGIINVAAGTYNQAAGEVFPFKPFSNQTFVGSTTGAVLLSGTAEYAGQSGDVTVIGNTWHPNVQFADANGHYTRGTFGAPMTFAEGNNFDVTTAMSTLEL